MKNYSLILFAAVALLSSFLSFAQQDLHRQPVGSTVTRHFMVAKKSVFLPDGDWTLIGASETEMRQRSAGAPLGLKWANLWLAQTQGKNLRALVRVTASIDAWAITRWLDKSVCDRTDMLFAKDLSRNFDDHFCNAINHHVNVLSGKAVEGSVDRQAFLWLEQNGIGIPATMVTVEFHRSAIPGNALHAWYHFNPEFDGFPPSASKTWSRNDWHKDFISRDPRKVAYVDALISWATTMAPAVEAGFKGGVPETRSYSGWPPTEAGKKYYK